MYLYAIRSSAIRRSLCGVRFNGAPGTVIMRAQRASGARRRSRWNGVHGSELIGRECEKRDNLASPPTCISSTFCTVVRATKGVNQDTFVSPFSDSGAEEKKVWVRRLKGEPAPSTAIILIDRSLMDQKVEKEVFYGTERNVERRWGDQRAHSRVRRSTKHRHRVSIINWGPVQKHKHKHKIVAPIVA